MTPRAALAAAIALVAIVAVAVAWLQDVPELSAADAVSATEAALADAGLEADVAPAPVRTTYTSRSRTPVDVWEVHATVRSEPIALRLAAAGATPIAIDDRNADGSAYVLSDAEFETLAHSVEDPARERAVAHNSWLTAAAALVVALAVVHAAQAAPTEEARR
ncbi:MAG: hypothetical protein ACJ739_16095 [Acidimicrobiales bacterium]